MTNTFVESEIPGGQPGTLDISDNYSLMDAYKYALEKIDAHTAYFQLSIVYDGKSKGLIQVNVDDPMAVQFLKDQIIATISGLITKKR